MDPLELAYWVDAVYSTLVYMSPEEDSEFREFCENWFRELVNNRERVENEVDHAGADRS